jgi:hypothetical protein
MSQEGRNRFGCISRGQHPVARKPQDFASHLANERLIFDQQDSWNRTVGRCDGRSANGWFYSMVGIWHLHVSPLWGHGAFALPLFAGQPSPRGTLTGRELCAAV